MSSRRELTWVYAAVACLLLIAVVSYHAYEMPFLRLKRRFTASDRRRTADEPLLRLAKEP